MAKGISKPSKYAAEWKKVRQTRVKASGMTALLEGLDRQWREYDGPYFVKNVMGNNALSDIKRNVDMITKAKDDVSALGTKFSKDYNTKEKDFIKDFVADMDFELNFWKETKRNHVLAGAGAKDAQDKLVKTDDHYQTSFTQLKAQAQKLEKIYERLVAADKLKDHSASPGFLEQFRKGVEEFNTAWKDTDARNEKRLKFALTAKEAHDKHAEAKDLLSLIATISKGYSEDRRALNVLQTDAKIWMNWVAKQLATH